MCEPHGCPRVRDVESFAHVEADRGAVSWIDVQCHGGHLEIPRLGNGISEQCTSDAPPSRTFTNGYRIDVPLALVVTPHEGFDGRPGEGHCRRSDPGPPPRPSSEHVRVVSVNGPAEERPCGDAVHVGDPSAIQRPSVAGPGDDFAENPSSSRPKGGGEEVRLCGAQCVGHDGGIRGAGSGKTDGNL
jgi:hypothetical protein